MKVWISSNDLLDFSALHMLLVLPFIRSHIPVLPVGGMESRGKKKYRKELGNRTWSAILMRVVFLSALIYYNVIHLLDEFGEKSASGRLMGFSAFERFLKWLPSWFLGSIGWKIAGECLGIRWATIGIIKSGLSIHVALMNWLILWLRAVLVRLIMHFFGSALDNAFEVNALIMHREYTFISITIWIRI